MQGDTVGNRIVSGGCDAIDAEFGVGAFAGQVGRGVAEVVVLGAAGDVVLAGAAGAVGCYEGTCGRAEVDDAGVGRVALRGAGYADGSAGVESGDGDDVCAVRDDVSLAKWKMR